MLTFTTVSCVSSNNTILPMAASPALSSTPTIETTATVSPTATPIPTVDAEKIFADFPIEDVMAELSVLQGISINSNIGNSSFSTPSEITTEMLTSYLYHYFHDYDLQYCQRDEDNYIIGEISVPYEVYEQAAINAFGIETVQRCGFSVDNENNDSIVTLHLSDGPGLPEHGDITPEIVAENGVQLSTDYEWFIDGSYTATGNITAILTPDKDSDYGYIITSFQMTDWQA